MDDPTPRTTPASATGDHLFHAVRPSGDYAAWAERLKAKRTRNREEIRARQRSGGDAGDLAGQEQDTSNWSADALFAESERVAAEERRTGATPASRRELYAMFNLAPTASMAEVTERYRGLAKLHHPDRYAGADPATQAHHAAQMAAINDAFDAIRRLAG